MALKHVIEHLCFFVVCLTSSAFGYLEILSAEDRVEEDHTIAITCISVEDHLNEHVRNLDRSGQRQFLQGHIQWFHGNENQEVGQELDKDSRISIQTYKRFQPEEEIVSNLTIRSALPSDAGNYTCCRREKKDTDWDLRLHHQRIITIISAPTTTEAGTVLCGSGQPCINGTCVPTNSSSGFKCDCYEGYEGKYCDHMIQQIDANHVITPLPVRPTTSFPDTTVTEMKNEAFHRKRGLVITLPVVGVIVIGLVIGVFVVKRLMTSHRRKKIHSCETAQPHSHEITHV